MVVVVELGFSDKNIILTHFQKIKQKSYLGKTNMNHHDYEVVDISHKKLI